MMRTAVLLVLCFPLAARVAGADCGSIPFKPHVQIFEPNQRAVIAWNGKTEILLLSTDLRASEPTKVLEVIPFPSEPKITKGDVEVFHKATWMINQRLSPRTSKGGGGMGGMGGGAFGGARPSPPAGQLTFQEKIGAHDIAVTRVIDRRRFIGWVEGYLKGQGVDNPTIPTPLKLVVQEYLRDGFGWFAFNVVELGTSTVTKDAIQYRFDTKFLYYPLRITRTDKGNTKVRLLLISPRLVKMPNLGAPKAKLMHRPLGFALDEVQYLDKDVASLFGGRSSVLMRIWEINGRLSSFKRDVVTTWY